MNRPTTRSPAVVGRFYPDDPAKLGRMVESFLKAARVESKGAPKAVIAPHAGYPFSGPVAGSAFRNWAEAAGQIRRVVVLGPSHWVDFNGIALPRATAFSTPLGEVPLDCDAINELRDLPQVVEFDPAHQREHCVEVELPFLQLTCSGFSLIPLVIGDAADELVSEVIERLWDGPETRFVISSDLSHYRDYETASRVDAATAEGIEQSRAEELTSDQACGFRAIRGFLLGTRARGVDVRLVDLRNSGDTAGSRDRVVGYGAFHFHEAAASEARESA